MGPCGCPCCCWFVLSSSSFSFSSSRSEEDTIRHLLVRFHPRSDGWVDGWMDVDVLAAACGGLLRFVLLVCWCFGNAGLFLLVALFFHSVSYPTVFLRWVGGFVGARVWGMGEHGWMGEHGRKEGTSRIESNRIESKVDDVTMTTLFWCHIVHE